MKIFDNFKKPQGNILTAGLSLGHSPLHRWCLSKVLVEKGTWILDVGCGDGKLMKELLSTCKDGRVDGIDSDASCVEKAKKAVAAHQNTYVWEAKAEDIPFTDDRYDLVTCFETVYYIDDRPAAFSEMKRVLKSGGKLLVGGELRDNEAGRKYQAKVSGMHLFEPEQIQKEMEDAGFSRARVFEEDSWWCVIGEK